MRGVRRQSEQEDRGPTSGRSLRGYEPELGTTLSEVLVAEGIEVLTNTRTERVSGDGEGVAVAVETRSAGRILRAERRVVATGRRPTDLIHVYPTLSEALKIGA